MLRNKNLKRLLKGTDSYIIATEFGSEINGSKSDLLTEYALLTKNLAEKLDKKDLKKAFDLAFMKEEEIEKEMEKKIKEFLAKLGVK